MSAVCARSQGAAGRVVNCDCAAHTCWCCGREARRLTVDDLKAVLSAFDMCSKRKGGLLAHDGGCAAPARSSSYWRSSSSAKSAAARQTSRARRASPEDAATFFAQNWTAWDSMSGSGTPPLLCCAPTGEGSTRWRMIDASSAFPYGANLSVRGEAPRAAAPRARPPPRPRVPAPPPPQQSAAPRRGAPPARRAPAGWRARARASALQGAAQRPGRQCRLASRLPLPPSSAHLHAPSPPLPHSRSSHTTIFFHRGGRWNESLSTSSTAALLRIARVGASPVLSSSV